MPRPHPDILDALRLRSWALAALTSPTPLPPPNATDAGWALFLGREACATRLLPAAGPNAPAPLRRAAEHETQVVLLLRAELEDILDLARGIGVVPVILKGGVALHDQRTAVSAKDLDLLLPEGEARTLVTALDAAGWRPVSGGTGHHFGGRVRDGRPPVEVHIADRLGEAGLGTHALDRAVPHPSLPGAHLLAPPDEIRYLTYHQTVQHSSHRGRLRDLLLLADAIGRSNALPEPSGWGHAAGMTKNLRAVLTMADALHQRVPAVDSFPEIAAVWYSMDAAARGRPEHPLRTAYSVWVSDFVAADESARERWRRAWRPRLDDAGWGAVFPGAGTGPLTLRRIARALWLPPLILLAWWRAQGERRQAGRLLQLLHRTPQEGQ